MRIRERLKIREIAGEKLVILERDQQVEFTQVMVLNKTSEWLWNQLINKDFSYDEVADLLYSKFEVDVSVAKKDANNWIELLKRHNILEDK